MTAADSPRPAARPMSRCATVTYARDARVADLLGAVAVGDVFTARERRACAARSGPTSWAGRLAGKIAVAGLLLGGEPPQPRSAGLADIEILPARHGLCADPARCPRSHRPEVTVGGRYLPLLADGEQTRISISHTRTFAVALAVRACAVPAPPPGERSS